MDGRREGGGRQINEVEMRGNSSCATAGLRQLSASLAATTGSLLLCRGVMGPRFYRKHRVWGEKLVEVDLGSDLPKYVLIMQAIITGTWNSKTFALQHSKMY